MKKNYRVYFNRRREAPQVWSVDEGTQSTEINVQWVRFEDVEQIVTVFSSEVPLDRRDKEPAAWLEFMAEAEFDGGGVIFR